MDVGEGKLWYRKLTRYNIRALRTTWREPRLGKTQCGETPVLRHNSKGNPGLRSLGLECDNSRFAPGSLYWISGVEIDQPPHSVTLKSRGSNSWGYHREGLHRHWSYKWKICTKDPRLSADTLKIQQKMKMREWTSIAHINSIFSLCTDVTPSPRSF